MFQFFFLELKAPAPAPKKLWGAKSSKLGSKYLAWSPKLQFWLWKNSGELKAPILAPNIQLGAKSSSSKNKIGSNISDPTYILRDPLQMNLTITSPPKQSHPTYISRLLYQSTESLKWNNLLYKNLATPCHPTYIFSATKELTWT